MLPFSLLFLFHWLTRLWMRLHFFKQINLLAVLIDNFFEQFSDFKLFVDGKLRSMLGLEVQVDAGVCCEVFATEA